MITSHSEYGQIKSILLKSATNAFESQEKADGEWRDLNYLEKIDYDHSKKEYRTFKEIISAEGAQILNLPKADTTIDSIYCRDASIATDFGMIICNMGKGARSTEPLAQKVFFESKGIPVLGTIESPGTLEGGDMCWLDEKTLAVGLTYRTNQSGISQLKSLLEPNGIEVLVVDLPHYKGKDDVFHLMSVISPIDKDLAVIYSPLMPIGFREALLNRGFSFVECPAEEFESMGCNVLALAQRKVLVVSGNPRTASLLQAKGCEVIVYEGEEISQKGCGGPTCLTRPINREI